MVIKLALPLSIVLFATITKWWYALPVDGPDTVFTGFPFPFVCDGWHTSLSLQIFVLAFLADFLTYWLFCSILCLGVNRLVFRIKPHKKLLVVLWSFAALVIIGATLLAANPNNIFYIKCPYNMEVVKTGVKFIGQEPANGNVYQYHPRYKTTKEAPLP